MANRSFNTLFSLNLTIGIGIALTIAVLIFTGAYWLANDQFRPVIIFFGAAVAAAGQLAAAFYAARTLRLAVDVEERRLVVEQRLEKEARAHISCEFGRRWTDASMFYLRNECQEIIVNRATPEQILKSLQEDPKKATNVSNILNFLEEVALSVGMKRCEEEIVKRLFCGIVINIWHATQPWVSHQRTTRGRSQIWMELESLYTDWRTGG